MGGYRRALPVQRAIDSRRLGSRNPCSGAGRLFVGYRRSETRVREQTLVVSSRRVAVRRVVVLLSLCPGHQGAVGHVGADYPCCGCWPVPPRRRQVAPRSNDSPGTAGRCTGFRQLADRIQPPPSVRTVDFPFAFIWAGRVARAVTFIGWRFGGLAAAALVWSVTSSLWIYPHSLSYFNELVGGPRGGHAYLDNSNIDWGQDLLYLKRWLDRHPEAQPLGVAYDVPYVDPRILGITYTWPPVGRDVGIRLPGRAVFRKLPTKWGRSLGGVR